ncbi:hypothetical protein FRC07_009467 [Ceratobasidium sp. 392]|nr:hypothetical protein FRC07_009467 [Ceratobasidium sp. 392]
MLKLQASCISSLEQRDSSGPLICAALDLIGHHAAPGILKSLVVSGSDFDQFWSRIKHSTRPFDSPINLQIGPVSNSVHGRTEELAAILSNTPSLQILWLQNNMLYHHKESSLQPIYLTELNALSLYQLDWDIMPQLLQALFVGESELYLRLECYDTGSESLLAVQSFLKRSKVVTLYTGWHSDEVLVDPLSLSHLRDLYLGVKHDCLKILELLVDSVQDEYHARFPHIKSLHLVNGSFDTTTQKKIKRIVQAYSLTEISFVCCAVGDRAESIPWKTNRDPPGKNFIESLGAYVAKVTVTYPLSSYDTPWDPVITSRNL